MIPTLVPHSEKLWRQLSPGSTRPIPTLESGDRLSRAEFERRYEAMPGLKKAELIERVVYVGSPVRITHSQPHAYVMGWLAIYCAMTPDVALYDNSTVRLDGENELQPDVYLRQKNSLRSQWSPDEYIEGPPELVVEVAGSTASYDIHNKKLVYEQSGVPEYVVWLVYENRLFWFRLENGRYVLAPADETGVIHNHIFPGLRLPVQALLEGNLAAILTELQKT